MAQATRSAEPQDYERSRSLALKLAMSLTNVLTTTNIFDDIVATAGKHSPSSAFRQGLVIAQARGLEREALAIAKLTRWLSVVKRDYGEEAFEDVVSEIASLLSLPTPHQQSTTEHDKQHSRSGTNNIPKIPGITLGIYRYGSYDWIAEVRVEKIGKLLKKLHKLELPQDLQQLAIEIFHSLYLLNPELHPRHKTSKELEALAEVTKHIRENRELRSLTVLDELLSLKITADILADIIKNIPNTQSAYGKSGVDLRDGGACNLVAETVRKALENALTEAEKDKKTFKVVNGIAASKVGHKISFDDKLELYTLLKNRPVFTATILDAIKTFSTEKGRHGGSIEFSGYKNMEDYTELPKTRVVEYAYPEAAFLKRLALKELNVKKYDEGTAGRKKKYVVLIDKSGSMAGEKIEWAKAVATSLLLNSDTEDVKIAFFDIQPHPEKPVNLLENPVDALTKVLNVEAEGGTSIDTALKYADEHVPGYTTVLITDGEDKVTYEPRNDLITVMVLKNNNHLKKISKKYVTVQELKGDVVRNITAETSTLQEEV